MPDVFAVRIPSARLSAQGVSPLQTTGQSARASFAKAVTAVHNTGHPGNGPDVVNAGHRGMARPDSMDRVFVLLADRRVSSLDSILEEPTRQFSLFRPIGVDLESRYLPQEESAAGEATTGRTRTVPGSCVAAFWSCFSPCRKTGG